MRREDKERRKKEGMEGKIVHRGFCHRRVEGFYGRTGEMEYEFARAWEKQNVPRLGSNFGQGLLQDLLTKEDTKYGLFHRRIINITGRDAAVAAEVIQWLGTNCGFAFLRQVLERSGYTLTQKKNNRDNDWYEELTAVSGLHRLLPKLSRVEIYKRLRSLSPGGYTTVCGRSVYYGKYSYSNGDGSGWIHLENWSCASAARGHPVYRGVSAALMAEWLYWQQERQIAEARAAVDAILSKKGETNGGK